MKTENNGKGENRCPRRNDCSFFRSLLCGHHEIIRLIEEQFCTGDYASCARLRIAQARGADRVPAGLFPSQEMLETFTDHAYRNMNVLVTPHH